MDLIKTINDVLTIYNEHERLYEELKKEPVVYYADYKVQKLMTIPGVPQIMIHKFDTSTRDFYKLCVINFSDLIGGAFIHIKESNNDTILFSYVNPQYISVLKNYSGTIRSTFTKDEMFNIRLEYDIPFSDEELKEYFMLTQNIKKHLWIYNQ